MRSVPSFDKQFAAFLDDDGTIGFIDALSGKIIQRSFFSTRLKGDFRHGRQLFERVEVLRRRLALRDEVSMVRGIDKSGTACRVPFPSCFLHVLAQHVVEVASVRQLILVGTSQLIERVDRLLPRRGDHDVCTRFGFQEHPLAGRENRSGFVELPADDDRAVILFLRCKPACLRW